VVAAALLAFAGVALLVVRRRRDKAAGGAAAKAAAASTTALVSSRRSQMYAEELYKVGRASERRFEVANPSVGLVTPAMYASRRTRVEYAPEGVRGHSSGRRLTGGGQEVGGGWPNGQPRPMPLGDAGRRPSGRALHTQSLGGGGAAAGSTRRLAVLPAQAAGGGMAAQGVSARRLAVVVVPGPGGAGSTRRLVVLPPQRAASSPG
jgi:hypothetical protein